MLHRDIAELLFGAGAILILKSLSSNNAGAVISVRAEEALT
jgi:hypothetical protein